MSKNEIQPLAPTVYITAGHQVFIGAKHVGRIRLTQSGLRAIRLDGGASLVLDPCSLNVDNPPGDIPGRAEVIAHLNRFYSAAPDRATTHS